MIQYPLNFDVQLVVPGEGACVDRMRWSSTTPLSSPLPCAIPVEFEGPGGGFSPEDFFALAIANCFAATFQVIADKSRVSFSNLSIQGQLTVDRDEQGRPWMKEMKLKIRVNPGSQDPARVLRILEKTSQSCLVIQSVKTKVDFQFEVSA